MPYTDNELDYMISNHIANGNENFWENIMRYHRSELTNIRNYMKVLVDKNSDARYINMVYHNALHELGIDPNLMICNGSLNVGFGQSKVAVMLHN